MEFGRRVLPPLHPRGMLLHSAGRSVSSQSMEHQPIIQVIRPKDDPPVPFLRISLFQGAIMKHILFSLLVMICFQVAGVARTTELDRCDAVWTSQSRNSSESMPCGGHDIGLNVWVQNGDLLFYISRSGTFDENNTFLKLGRVRVRLTPNPLDGTEFRQELVLSDGSVVINGTNDGCSARVRVWVDVRRPVIHVDVSSSKPLEAEATYETWRYKDHRELDGENFENSYRWGPYKNPITFHDEISFHDAGVLFYHRNHEKTAFDVTVKQQGLDSVRSELFNPLRDLTFGGFMTGSGMSPAGNTSGKYVDTDYKGWVLRSSKPSTTREINIYLYTGQTKSADEWKADLFKFVNNARPLRASAEKESAAWWQKFWDRAFIYIDPDSPDTSSPDWQTGRNYQLFRYMLGCNAYGEYPTKFNGGLFTFDPVFIDSTKPFTPDYRNWGGGTFTAQNQRLVYYPMLKDGDFGMMKPQFDFYNRILHNAELRTEVYWHHKGACFTEQLEKFGLPNCFEYGWNRPPGFEKGLQYNLWLEYTWDTSLEFCYMILQTQRYNNSDISRYMPLIESCLTFFNEHYQYLALKRGHDAFSQQGYLVLYPGSAGETYKMAYDPNSTIAALHTVLTRLLELPDKYLPAKDRPEWETMLKRIPPISYRECDGHVTIAPAIVWQRVQNIETMQLYPVFPWRMFGIGRPGLDTAINTYEYDPYALKFRSYIGWKQDNIWAACLGLTGQAEELTVKKLENGKLRFPAFWGPGFDWAPDHNWGGTGMIGLQEMLLQTKGRKIFLFPAWPGNWNVHFKLHAPYETTVEGIVKDGKVQLINVTPQSRAKDVVDMFGKSSGKGG